MEEKIEGYETCSSEKLSNIDYKVNNLNMKIEEECAFDYENIITAFTCVKPKETNNKYQLETASYCIDDVLDVENMKGELPQRSDICTIIEDNYCIEKQQNIIIKSEEKIDGATSESVKFEEIDIKYEPLGNVRNKNGTHSETEGNICGDGSVENIKKDFACDTKNLDIVIKIENEIIEMDRTTFECAKSEEIDIKYEPGEPVRLSYTITEEIDIGSSKNYILPLEDSRQHLNLLDESIYECDLCPYETEQEKYLQAHMMVHEDELEFQTYHCDRCTYTSKYKRHLREHKLKSLHLTETDKHELKHSRLLEKKIYKCSTCSYIAQYKNEFLKHMSEHKLSDLAEEDVFKCQICNYKNKLERNFKTHMIVHSSEVHKCPTCNFVSKHKSRLKTHMLRHLDRSDKKMYKCAECSYSTDIKYSLKSHSLYHRDSTEVDIYSCDQCGYETKYKGALRTHRQRTHKNNFKSVDS